MNPADRTDLIRKLDLLGGGRSKVLSSLGVPRSTFYHWRSEYDQKGKEAFKKAPSPRKIWNKLAVSEVQRVVEIAL